MTEKYLTKKGLQRLQRELKELKTTRRHEISEKLKHAIASGDLSENAEYQEAKEEQAFAEGRISELETILASAVLINEQQGTIVKIGSTVEVERIDAKEKRNQKTFTIVGAEEADPTQGSISHLSPLGAALLGHRAQETVDVITPSGPAKWRIKKVQ